MTCSKIDKYVTEISKINQTRQIAERLAEIDTRLEPYQGNMFVKLSFSEYAFSEKIGFGADDGGDMYSGELLYGAQTQVVTGVYTGIGFNANNKNISFNGRDFHTWINLWIHKGPIIDGLSISLPLDVQIVQAKEDTDGILVWNRNLPVFGTREYQDAFLMGARYAPRSLLNGGMDSVAVVIGNTAVVKLFGIEAADGITDTRSLYQAILAQQGMDTELLSRWNPGIIKGNPRDIIARADAFGPLEERIGEMPKTFFKEGIFTRYGIERTASR